MKKKKVKKNLTEKIVSPYDPLGSYTGSYLVGEYEEPVQDADDL
jgi:hypothetical protein